jgi:poly(3-hydroxybutyrate) depolymerase
MASAQPAPPVPTLRSPAATSDKAATRRHLAEVNAVAALATAMVQQQGLPRSAVTAPGLRHGGTR